MCSKPELTYIDSQPELDRLVQALKLAERVAVDTEGDSLYHYFDKVCLIQLTFDSANYIVDPLADLDLSGFIALLPTKSLYFHGGDFDLRMLKANYDMAPPSDLFDTMLAAQILGRERLGLAALAEEIAEVKLPKGDKKSDWSRRPLSETQIAYAANDTRYLFQIADELKVELTKLKRLDWVSEACQAMTRSSMIPKETSDPDREWRIKGMSRMSQRELALVRAIWYFRDAEARKTDRPPFKILGNNMVIELARNYADRSAKGLEITERLPKHFGRSRIEGLTKAIKKALTLAEDQLPERIKMQRVEPAGPEVELLRDECARLAEQHKIPPSVLAPRAALETIARHQATEVNEMTKVSKILRWQAEIIQPAVKQIIGRIKKAE